MSDFKCRFPDCDVKEPHSHNWGSMDAASLDWKEPVDPEGFLELYREWVDANGSRSPSIKAALRWVWRREQEAILRVRELEKENQRLKYVPGVLECKKCGFVLVSSTLNVNSGTITANNKPDSCQNGCGPMWKVSYAEDRKVLIKKLEKAILQNRALAADNEIKNNALKKLIGEIESDCGVCDETGDKLGAGWAFLDAAKEAQRAVEDKKEKE